MSGPIEWAVLVFVGSLTLGAMGLAWRARSFLARYELKYDMALAALSRAIEDRNFLLRYDLAIADLTKDVRHLKGNLDQHAVISAEMHDDLIRTQAEVARLGKIVNGKH